MNKLKARLKKSAVALVLYVVIPFAVLFNVYYIVDSNSDSMRRLASIVKNNLSPTLVFQTEQLLSNLNSVFGSSKTDTEEEDEALPLIKAQANKKTPDGAFITENFIEQRQTAAPTLTSESINKIPLEYLDETFVKEDILDDKLNRLPQDFKIAPEMKDRVGFWLDIYTKYTSRFSVIHDEERPWIIYKVVDAREIYSQPGSQVTLHANEMILIAREKKSVTDTLKKLSKRKNAKDLTADETKFARLLESTVGKRKTVFSNAEKHIRIQRGQKDFYRNGVIESSKYLNEMEEIFAHHDLPTELVRLPLVESSFNEDATSKVGASGIWQFMPSVGAHYVKMGATIDERNSPIKATDAAAKLLRSNFKMLKNWPLAITAYNHGAGGLVKASKNIANPTMFEIIQTYKSKSFSFASKNFYSEFMAALYGERYQEEIFGSLVKLAPLAADEVILKKKMRLRDVAEIAGVTMEEIKLHNPDLRKHLIKENPFLPKGYTIRLPLGRGTSLELYYQQQAKAG